jgi:hypothetical protein
MAGFAAHRLIDVAESLTDPFVRPAASAAKGA